MSELVLDLIVSIFTCSSFMRVSEYYFKLLLCSCQGYVVPEKKDACTVDASEVMATASKVSIQAKKGDVWVLTPVKGKKDTYTIRAVSFENKS